METVIEYSIKDQPANITSDEGKWIRHIRKLAEEYPDDVRIVAQPETNDGAIFAYFPVKWVKVKPPVKRELGDEQKQKIAARLKNNRRTNHESTVE